MLLDEGVEPVGAPVCQRMITASFLYPFDICFHRVEMKWEYIKCKV
jgi:hypothetical protein